MKVETQFVSDTLTAGVGLVSAASIAVGLVVAGILAWYPDTAWSMVTIWQRSETFAHGYVVVPIALWDAWTRREALARTPATPFWPALLAVAAAGAGWLLATLTGVAVVAQYALVVMLQASIVAVLGLALARQLAFPLAFLLFAVPAGEFLVPWLMDRTADFTIAALAATGIPVYREGNQFVIPSGMWSVVEACSGIRYLIASLMAGVLYAHLAYRSRGRKLAFIGASIAVPIVANWLRAYLIVLIGHLSGNKYAVNADHLIYGWLFFGVVIFLLFWVGSFWREDGSASAAPTALAAPGFTAPGAPRASLYAAALAAILVAAMWRPVAAMIDGAQGRAPVSLEAVSGAGGWTPVRDRIADWSPRFIGPGAQRHQTFEKGGARVGLYLAFYRNQSDGNELVTSENVLVTTTDPHWRQTARGTAALPWTGGASVTALAAELRGKTAHLAVRELYWIDGRVTASDHMAKILLALAKLTGRGDDSAAIVFYTQVSGTPGAAQSALDDFAREMSPAVEAALVRTAGR